MGKCGQPTVGAIRRQLGLPVPPATPNLEAASSCKEHAWMLYQWAVAHLVYAARHTVGDAQALFVAQETLHEWAEDEALKFNELADEMIAEAAAWPQADWPRYSPESQ